MPTCVAAAATGRRQLLFVQPVCLAGSVWYAASLATQRKPDLGRLCAELPARKLPLTVYCTR